MAGVRYRPAGIGLRTMMMAYGRALGVLAAVAVLGCSQPTQPAAPTPDVEATVRARVAATVQASVPTAEPASPPEAPSGPAQDTSLAGQVRYIANSGGQGVRVRDGCDDNAPGSGGLVEGAQVTVEFGQADCEGWLYIRRGAAQSWVRERYLSSGPPARTQAAPTAAPVPAPAQPTSEPPPSQQPAAPPAAPAQPASASCEYTNHPQAQTRGGGSVGPSSPVIKGNVSQNTGERIYHLPGQQFYRSTVISESQGERWFCTEREAQQAGWRGSRVQRLVPDGGKEAMVLAAVVRVIDGDTIEVALDGSRERVRYIGVDTPEVGERCAQEATQRNALLVGGRVYLEPDASDRDRYGRLLRYAWTVEVESVDQTLIAEGLARAWYGSGKYRDLLIATADEAHAFGIGCLFG